jgi:hypothetical protein
VGIVPPVLAGAGEALRRARTRLRSLDLAILWRRCRDQILEQVLRDVGDFVDSALERVSVGLRRFGRSADLAHVLQRGSVHLFIVRGGFEIMQGVDVSAHVNEAKPRRHPAQLVEVQLPEGSRSLMRPAGAPFATSTCEPRDFTKSENDLKPSDFSLKDGSIRIIWLFTPPL